MTRITVLMMTITLLPLTLGCGGRRAGGILFPQGLRLELGDLLFRQGCGFTSHVVRFADKGGSYSHVGIVARVAGGVMVVHAVPGEADGGLETVKMETVEEFFATNKADAGCVMRCRDSMVAARAAAVALDVWKRGTPFDHGYDDRDTTQMYCCELVEHAYTAAGMPLVAGVRHDFSIPGASFRHVILPSDFTRSRHLRRVAEF